MEKKISVKVCLGTTCFVMGSANLQELIEMVPKKYGEKVEVTGVPCLGLCSIDWEFSKAPYVKVDEDVIKEATVEKVLKAIDDKLEAMKQLQNIGINRNPPFRNEGFLLMKIEKNLVHEIIVLQWNKK